MRGPQRTANLLFYHFHRPNFPPLISLQAIPNPCLQIKMDWENPLRNLPACAPHPAPESVVSSKLSSILEDSNHWYDSRSAVLKTLEDHYVPNSPEDDTLKVLRTFVMKLPKRGQLALMSEIRLFKDNPAKLRQLRNFLVDAILKPSMPPFSFLGVACG